MFGRKKLGRRTKSQQTTQEPDSCLRLGNQLYDDNGRRYWSTYFTKEVRPISNKVMRGFGLLTPIFREGDRGPNFENPNDIHSGVVGDYTTYVQHGAIAGKGVCLLDNTVLKPGANVQGFTCIKSSEIQGYVCDSYLKDSHVEGGSVINTYGDGMTVFDNAQCNDCIATRDVQFYDNSHAENSRLHQAKLTGESNVTDCKISQSLVRDVKAANSEIRKSGICGGDINDTTIYKTTIGNLYGVKLNHKRIVEGKEISPISYDAQPSDYEDLRNQPGFEEGY